MKTPVMKTNPRYVENKVQRYVNIHVPS